MAGLVAAKARGRNGGRPKALTEEKKTWPLKRCKKGIAKGLGVSDATVYRYQQELKEQGKLKWIVPKNEILWKSPLITGN